MPILAEIEGGLKEAVFAGGTLVGQNVMSAGLPAEDRIDIHRNHVQRSLTHVLQATYPAVASLTDVRFFAWVAHEFLLHHPPTSPCLFEYGGDFADFIERFPACAGLPYLADVARLEWAIHSVFHAPDEAHAAVLLVSRFPVHQIWRAALNPDSPGADLGSGPAYLHVYRDDGDASFDVIDAELFQALSRTQP